MSAVKPIKRLGQNYLKDKNIIRKIVGVIDPCPDDIILEIGPGTGALTRELYGIPAKYFAVEIDKRVIEDLKFEFKDINLINKSFLDVDLNLITDAEALKVVGNIPYNITSPIIFKLIGARDFIASAVLMVQHEVAKRITAKRGSKDYGILSVILQFMADVQYCFKVSSNVFYPRPKVDSAVIIINFKKDTDTKVNTDLFAQVVKASFGNRRKTLKNSLSNSIFKDYNFNKINLDFNRRAEELSVDEYVFLTLALQKEFDERK
ncbi:MAG: ribosomal RNA small subunit methyltransferase A [Melioribacteraceae bacterium]|nr:ribosomal RNA small subunit methyltransferase A [Melioribacteraceae bacterium]